MQENTLLIFVKNPLEGKVKTRLAKTLGHPKAVKIYKRLLEYTASITSTLPATKIVFYNEWVEFQDEFENVSFRKDLQSKGDLGNKMKNAFKKGFDQEAKNVMIIGSDCPEISKKILEEAFEMLQFNDAVIGPAIDGGYYLLGMNRFLPYLFDNKTWSTSKVFNETIDDFKTNELDFHVLPKLRDLDTEEDYLLLKDKF